MGALIDLTGRQFGLWTVLRKDDSVYGQTSWLCVCACGTERIVAAQSLRKGVSRSCGCIKGKLITEANSTHGMSHTRTYQIWLAMHQRCRGHGSGRLAKERYLDRGITVCERWNDFKNFIEDMGEAPEGLTLERIDNNKGYSPDNCEWATREAQASNRGNTKLTKEQIEEIRRLGREGIPGERIGPMFGISKNYARDLIRGKSRKES